MTKKPCRLCRQMLPTTALREKPDGTRTLTCVKCLAERRPYQQAYRHTHKEQIAKSKQKYRAKHKPENSAYQRQYYVANKARLTGRKRDYYQKNRDKERARRQRYYHTHHAQETERQRHYYQEKHAGKRGANALTSPDNGGPAKRTKADAAHEQGR